MLERQGGTAATADPGVDPVRVRLEHQLRRLVEQRDLLLGDTPPAEGSHEAVGAQLRGSEQLGEATGGHVTSEVHLPEAVLCVDVALRHEQVPGVGRDDRRDAVGIALDGDRAGQAAQDRGARRVGEGATDRDDTGHRAEHDGDGDDDGQTCSKTTHPADTTPVPIGRTWTRRAGRAAWGA